MSAGGGADMRGRQITQNPSDLHRRGFAYVAQCHKYRANHIHKNLIGKLVADRVGDGVDGKRDN